MVHMFLLSGSCDLVARRSYNFVSLPELHGSDVIMADLDKKPWKHPPDFPVINGIIYLPHTTEEFLESISQLPVQQGDIFVATYPKAGTTWASEIVWQVYNDGKLDNKDIRERILHIEGFGILKERFADNPNSIYKGTISECYAKKPHPRIFKTHLHYHYVPKGEGSAPMPKFIYVIRNPKDCAVSFYHNMRRFKYYEFDRDWDEYFELLMKGEVQAGYWMDHVLSWWAQKDNPNILFLKYEDMKKDLESAVRKIAQFVGKDLSEQSIKNIASQTTFDSMKDAEQFCQEKNSKVLIKGESNFIRKGIVGDWRNYFTEEQNKRFDELYATKMAGGVDLKLNFKTVLIVC